jgi:pimeloyl-ACP methyl ester carboxylesterase
VNCRPLALAVIVALCSIARAQTEQGDFDSNGVNIHYATTGAGEAIVLIHGWMGDSTMWGKDASGNTKLTGLPGFQVIAIDCRGHGKSGKPHDPSQYGPEMAADVLRLLDHLKIKRAHFIGYSMGAFIAGKVVATHPERVISVIYGGQAPLLIGESGSREIDVFAKAVKEGKGLGPYLVEFAPPPKPTLEVANAIAKILYAGKDLEAWSAAGRSFKGLEVRVEDLEKCKAPTLFIYGSEDAQSTQRRVAQLRKSLPWAELKVIEGSNHVTTLARPEFGSAIVAFVQAHGSPQH